MTIELPDVQIGSLLLNETEARLALALGLYAGRKVSLGRAAKIAGIPYVAFMQEMARHGICMNYSVADLEQDMRTLELLAAKKAA